MERCTIVRLTSVAVTVAALGACGDDGGATPVTTSARPAVVVTETSLTGILPTTAPPPDTEASTDTTVVQAVPGGDGYGYLGFGGPMTDYLGPPMDKVLGRTTAAGVRVDVYRQSSGMSPPGDGPGWNAAPWCAPTALLRIGMQYGDAIGVSSSSLNDAPFGGISSQTLVSGYAEGQPFTVLLVQGGRDLRSVEATFSDGTVDAADAVEGLAVLAAPAAPSYEEMMWNGPQPPSGLAYQLTLHRDGGTTELASADVPVPGQDDYERDCTPPTELPEPGEQPADPAAAEQAVRDAFAVVFDIDGRAEGDRSWLSQLDSDEGVEAAIEQVLGGNYGSAARAASYAMGDVVFTSPTEAWFQYDLTANGSRFAQRFGLAVEVDGAWKLSRGVICQDLALGGGHCEPPIGQIYPPRAG